MPRFENLPYYLTAYGLAVKRGFKGTLDEWLASLKGDQGDQGEKGDTGEKGDKVEMRYLGDKIQWRWLPDAGLNEDIDDNILTDNYEWRDLIEIKRPVYLVTINSENMAEQEYSDILAAHRSGYDVKCLYNSPVPPRNGYLLPIVLAEDVDCIFSGIVHKVVYNVVVHPNRSISAGKVELAEIADLPKKTSDLINDSGFISRDEVAEQIPTKVSDLVDDSGFLKEAPVTSVNGQEGDVTIDVPVTSVNGQVGAVTVPTAVKVTVSQTEDGKYIADLYSEQLMEAYNQGRMLYCEFGTRILSLMRVSKAQMVFGCVQAGAVYQIFVGDQTATLTISPLHSGDGSGSLTITDDGNGNVTITTVSGSSITDETGE